MLARAAPAPVRASCHRRSATPSGAIARRRPQPQLPHVCGGGVAITGAGAPSSPLRPLPSPRSRFAASANNDNSNNNKVDEDSNGDNDDLAYVAKVAALSLAGAAAIKYGSLLVALPHEPSLPVALAIVLGTPALYSAWLLTRR
jgi:hypothetical protein